MYGRYDSRTTKPQQVQLIVVMAKILSVCSYCTVSKNDNE